MEIYSLILLVLYCGDGGCLSLPDCDHFICIYQSRFEAFSPPALSINQCGHSTSRISLPDSVQVHHFFLLLTISTEQFQFFIDLLERGKKWCEFILINGKISDIIGNVHLESPLLIHHQSLTIIPGRFTESERLHVMSVADGHFKGEQIFSIYQKYPTFI